MRATADFVIALGTTFVTWTWSGPAFSQDAGPEQASALDRSTERARIPPAATGFQGALRTGASLPWGDATAAPGDTFADRYAWQIPIQIDAGLKLKKALLVGAYFGFGYGGEGANPAIEAVCDDDDDDLDNEIVCRVFTFQFGVQAQYQLGPSEFFNPWLGYGAGFEIIQQSLNDKINKYRESHLASGYTLVKLAAGLDYRGPVGIGPFAEVTLGRFLSSSTTVNGQEVHSGPVDAQAWHGWLTVGARVVLFP